MVSSLHSAPAADDDVDLGEDEGLLDPMAGDAVGVDFMPTHWDLPLYSTCQQRAQNMVPACFSKSPQCRYVPQR